MKKGLKIGNAQAFWGDSPHAAYRLVQQQPDLDFLTLDYLSEVSMSIMAIQKEKDPLAGYAKDFLGVIRSLTPLWSSGSQLRLISNAGGLNPMGCAQACTDIIKKSGCRPIKIGVVMGDDVLQKILSNSGNALFSNLDTGESIQTICKELVTANAYLGAQSIAEALDQGAEIVITGRVADPSLTVGPCLSYFKWQGNEYDKIAGATIAGHLIECGTQVTGGISTHWLDIPDPAHIGFPFVEIYQDGSFIISKPEGTSGSVTLETVKEQLLYEIGDPDNYLSPDAIVSFLSLKLVQESPDRVHITGAVGRPPPSTLKVSATYRDGYRADGILALFGKDVIRKAKRCGEIILQRVKDNGFELRRSEIECLGNGDIVPGLFTRQSPDPVECVLRISVADPRREALESFVKEIAPLVTSGPQGIVGYVSGRPPIRQVFGYWPCLIDAIDLYVQVNYVNSR
jgi:Acyclic terpene utilisation family protein AtuA